MKDKRIIDELKNAYDIPISNNKLRFIRSINKPKISLGKFIFNQFKLINKKVYICCFVYFIVLLVLLLASKPSSYLLLSGGVPFFSLIIVCIINTSNMYHMEEIEKATLFSLKMVILARMLIISSIILILIMIVAILTSNVYGIPLLEMIYYFFIPYFINMYINLKLLQKYKKDGIKYCFLSSSIICLLIIFLITKPLFISLFNSNLSLLLLIILMLLTIQEFMNYIRKLEDYVWNLQ